MGTIRAHAKDGARESNAVAVSRLGATLSCELRETGPPSTIKMVGQTELLNHWCATPRQVWQDGREKRVLQREQPSSTGAYGMLVVLPNDCQPGNWSASGTTGYPDYVTPVNPPVNGPCPGVGEPRSWVRIDLVVLGPSPLETTPGGAATVDCWGDLYVDWFYTSNERLDWGSIVRGQWHGRLEYDMLSGSFGAASGSLHTLAPTLNRDTVVGSFTLSPITSYPPPVADNMCSLPTLPPAALGGQFAYARPSWQATASRSAPWRPGGLR